MSEDAATPLPADVEATAGQLRASKEAARRHGDHERLAELDRQELALYKGDATGREVLESHEDGIPQVAYDDGGAELGRVTIPAASGSAVSGVMNFLEETDPVGAHSLRASWGEPTSAIFRQNLALANRLGRELAASDPDAAEILTNAVYQDEAGGWKRVGDSAAVLRVLAKLGRRLSADYAPRRSTRNRSLSGVNKALSRQLAEEEARDAIREVRERRERARREGDHRAAQVFDAQERQMWKEFDRGGSRGR